MPDEPSDAEQFVEAEFDAALDAFVAEEIEHECWIGEATEAVFNSDSILLRLVNELAEADLWPLVIRAMSLNLAVDLEAFAVARARMPCSLSVH